MNVNKIIDTYTTLKNKQVSNKLSVSEIQAFNTGFTSALKEFFNPAKKVQAYKFGSTADVDRITSEGYDILTDRSAYDNGWELCFKQVSVPAGSDSWTIATGSTGLTFEKINEGENIKVSTVSGLNVTVYLYKYGFALGITDEMIKFRKTVQMMDLFEEAREKYYYGKASTFYTLLTTGAAANTVTWQGAVTDSQVLRDITTINKGASTIATNMSTKVANAANAPLVLIVHPSDRSRIEAAFNYAGQGNGANVGVSSNNTLTSQPIKPVYSFFATSGYPTLVYPNRKNKYAIVEDLTEYKDTNVLNMTHVHSYISYMGGCVADTDQLAKLSLS